MLSEALHMNWISVPKSSCAHELDSKKAFLIYININHSQKKKKNNFCDMKLKSKHKSEYEALSPSNLFDPIGT